MKVETCVPCLSKGVKQVLKDSTDPELHEMIDSVRTCPVGEVLRFCPVESRLGARKVKATKRPRSAYQEFISQCMKSKPIKGKPFGEAAKYMKECAHEWRNQGSRAHQSSA